MTDIIQSIILGLAQGLGEFLPISSSAHLILIPKIFGWPDHDLAFDVALHLGTLAAVLCYFYEDWKSMIKNSYFINKAIISNFQFPISKQALISSLACRQAGFKFQNLTPRIKNIKTDLLFIIIISTAPGVISGFLLEKKAETVFRDPILIAITLSLGGLMLFYADKIGKKNTSIFTLKNGIVIGIAQAFAIIPGISRSGITIAAALILGFDRVSAARFSFLLSTPIILGAGVKEIPHLIKNGADLGVILGAATAGISGYLAIKYMLKYLENKNYNIFVAYRLLLAAVILAIFYR